MEWSLRRLVALPLALAFCVAFAVTDAVAFFVDDVPVTDRDVRVNRVLLELDGTPPFSPFRVLGGAEYLTAAVCPMSTFAQEVRQADTEVRRAVLYHASAASRPSRTEVDQLVASSKVLSNPRLQQRLEQLGLTLEDWAVSIQRMLGLAQALDDAAGPPPTALELEFLLESDPDLPLEERSRATANLRQDKRIAGMNRWAEAARRSATVRFLDAVDTPWNPVVASIADIEVRLNDLLYELTGASGGPPAVVTAGLENQIVADFVCLAEQGVFQRDPPQDWGTVTVQFSAPELDLLTSNAETLTLRGLVAAALERLLDQAVTDRFARESKLPFAQSGRSLQRAVTRYQSRHITVSEPEIRAYYVANKRDFTTPARAKVLEFVFQTAKRATAFREEIIRKGYANIQPTAQRHGGLLEDYGAVSAEEAPYGCENLCFSPGKMNRTGTGYVSPVTVLSSRYTVFVVGDLRPATLQPLDRVRAKVTRAVRDVARDKYGRQWLTAQRQRLAGENNFDDVLGELERRAKTRR